MKLFVTGGTGFIGSHFLREAVQRGHQVVALRRTETTNADPAIEWVEGDLESYPPDTLAGCEALVHLAAHGVTDPGADLPGCLRWNVVASRALLLAAAEAGVRRFVVCGSCFEYGRSAEQYDAIPVTAPLQPVGPYAASKVRATGAALTLARERQLELIVLRPFHVFGEGEAPTRFWPALRRAAASGEDFPMTPGEQVRDFTPVDIVAKAFADALTRPDLIAGEPRIENVGTGIPSTLLDFAQHWWKTWGAQGKLLPGAVPYRDQEVMRYVPELPGHPRT